MKVIRHTRHADQVMRIEGTLAVAGVVGGVLLWIQAGRWDGYVCALFAFLALLGVRAGFHALQTYNRYQRGASGEESVLAALHCLPDTYTAVTNFVVPGTRQGDMDLVVLGPAGVLVIEVKSYTGKYGCQGDAWFMVHADGTRQPLRSSVSRQLKRARKAAQHYLVDCDVSVPVYAIAVFRPGVELDLIHPTVSIVMQPELEAYLFSLPPASHPRPIVHLEPLFMPPIGKSQTFALRFLRAKPTSLPEFPPEAASEHL